MVYQVSVNSNFDLNKKNDFSFTDKDYKFSFTKNENIFVGDEAENTEYSVEESTEILEAQLQEIQDKNGYKMQLWDKTKNALNVGANSEKCEKSIEKYKNGEITFEEALAEIENYGEKQDNSLNLFSNILTSFVAIGAATVVAVATGGAATPLVLAAVGAGSGAIAKAGTKLVDRATNKIENDELDAKQIGKDMLSGAVTGAIAQVTMGTGSGTKVCAEAGAGAVKSKIAANVGKNALKSAKTGVKFGAISGAANYTIDCTFEKDKKFNIEDLAKTSVSNAIVGGTVGTIVGGANGFLRAEGLLTSGGAVIKNGQLANTSVKDVLANSGCSTAHKILNNEIKNS